MAIDERNQESSQTDAKVDRDFNPFELDFSPRWLANLAGRLFGLSRLAKFYRQRPRGLAAPEFLRYTLDCFNTHFDQQDPNSVLQSIPRQGPLLIIANHPLGGLEGVALAEMLLKYRPDLKVLTNELLTRIPELADIFVGVDVFSDKGSSRNNSGILEISRHLKQGGALLLFPAGKVAQYHFRRGDVYDHDWHRIAGHLVSKVRPSVLPIYVEGYNSRLFYLAAMLHPLLRSAMLPRELSNKSNYHLSAHIGQLITPQETLAIDDARTLTDYLRLSTELSRPLSRRKKTYQGLAFQPLRPSNNISIDSIRLPDEQYKLSETGKFAVYCAAYEQLNDIAEKIGEARELTFREAGEGTGNAVDIDRFDPYYLHLFVWDKTQQRVAGGYRIGKVDEIVAQRGIDALYSRTLYAFNEAYLLKLGNALEIGRSFVHPDYQRQSKSLDLLWKGIGLYVAKNPEYHTLFGAVSISNEHSDLARALIAESMLQSFRAEQRYLENVRPVAPLKVSGRVWTSDMLASLSSVSLINKLIGRCDPGKALPTLLRHYLSLNGRFVCFSVNRVFNNSLDGLIIVDMRETPQRYLDRYLGKEGAAHCQQTWQQQISAEQIA